MFTVLRMETLDTWDQILYITMYGCAEYPDGYEFLQNYPQSECKNSEGIGVYGFGILLLVVIIGAYVLPTVLIGIVSIKFDNTSKRLEKIEEEKRSFVTHLKEAKVSELYIFIYLIWVFSYWYIHPRYYSNVLGVATGLLHRWESRVNKRRLRHFGH